MNQKLIVRQKERKKKIGDYFLGLDIGTNSVGWAVTDEKYKVIKFNGKKMWGSRLFDAAKTAEERRSHRSSRRRLARRKNRLNILESIFSEEIAKVDPNFLMRLKESKYHIEDKEDIVDTKYILFSDENYNDVDFYKKYPTIYHLRQALIEGKEKDIRCLYIAVHNILKNRGNFLYQGEFIDSGAALSTNVKKVLLEENEMDFLSKETEFDEKKVDEITEILKDTLKNKNDKKQALKKIFGKNKKLQTIFSLAIGSKVSIKDIFGDQDLEELDKDVTKITFQNVDYDEIRDKYEEAIGDRILLIDDVKALYDSIILNTIKPEGKTLSQAKIDSYEKHRKDLRTFKNYIKETIEDGEADKSLYKEIFRADLKNGKNYVNYVHGSKQEKSSCSREDFYKFIVKKIEELPENEIKESILKDIENETFLPLQRVKDNGVIPYQIHKNELKAILDNASDKFDFLNKMEDGISVKEKIIMLLTFRIPYYVGPLNDYNSNNGFSWVVRKERGKVLPWNFKDKVDVEASAEKFIMNMTNKCSYLIEEDVLPRESLLYSEFTLLNELNNIKIDGKKLTFEIKQSIIDDIFKKRHQKVSKKVLRDYLVSNGYYDRSMNITGMDDFIQSDLLSYRDMHTILNDKFDYNMAENIIKWITVYCGEEKILYNKIKNEYGDILDERTIKKIIKLRYKNWGRLSRKLLEGIFSDKLFDESTGECMNIISAMNNTNNNLMELLSSSYDFINKIEEINRESLKDVEKVDYDLIDELYLPVYAKRSLWQAVKIVEEIKNIMGYEPKKIFLETTRTNKAAKEKKDSRKKQLQKLYSNIKDTVRDWNKEIENTDESYFRSKKVYLYYTQMGRCAYSGEPIDIEKLNEKYYDIEHIYPRSKTKDNSIDNLVLVKAELNREKGDKYPISNRIQTNMKKIWDLWHDKGLISDNKYERLVRKDGFSDNELSGFIARQIVQTSQSTIAAARLFENMYENTRVVYVKAENVSDFRTYSYRNKNYEGFIKVRSINNYHHAKDAYLNIVVGNVYDEKFTSNPIRFIKENAIIAKDDEDVKNNKDKNEKYNLEKIMQYRLVRNGKEIWSKDLHENVVQKMMKSNDVRVTKRCKEGKGELFNATIYKAEKTKDSVYFPLKKSDIRLQNMKKYGGYSSISTSYYTFVEYEYSNKKGIVKSSRFIPVPTYIAINENLDIETFIRSVLEKEMKKGENIINFEQKAKKVMINSIIELDGNKYYMQGKTDDSSWVSKVQQLVLSDKDTKLVKNMQKYLDSDFKYSDLVDDDECIELYDILIEKLNMPIYKNVYSNKYEELSKETTLDLFKKLELNEKVKILFELIGFFNDAKNMYDLKKIKVNITQGRASLKMSKVENIKLINQSITGLFENEIVLKG